MLAEIGQYVTTRDAFEAQLAEVVGEVGRDLLDLLHRVDHRRAGAGGLGHQGLAHVTTRDAFEAQLAEKVATQERFTASIAARQRLQAVG
jgi:hypothetical protein